jgi:1D-myo-inositol-tetrakisphosphate 5-kinase/inositol-polyphosphate multikinase
MSVAKFLLNPCRFCKFISIPFSTDIMGDVRNRMTSGTINDRISFLDAFEAEELSYQVAGHRGKVTGLLTHKDHKGFIMKPMQKGELGLRELDFYRCLEEKESDDEISNILKSIIPEYRGLACVQSVGDAQEVVKTDYLILKDIAYGFELPCLIDIKMGKQTWDPTASEAKINTEKSKYPGTRPTLGFSVPGIQYYNLSSPDSDPIRGNKQFGRNLNHKTVFKAFQDFLNKDSDVEKIIGKVILQKLEKISDFFKVQKQYAFYASSLLVAYDAKFVEKNIIKKTATTPHGMGDGNPVFQDLDWVRIYMIDFTHVFPGDQLDDNYIFALRNVKGIFSAIVDGKTDYES